MTNTKQHNQNKQSKVDWLDMEDEVFHYYHESQFKQPYRSTVLFCDWLETLGILSQKPSEIIDFCAGKGGNLFYMAKRYPYANFTGIELNPKLVKSGNEKFENAGQKNCILLEGDVFKVDKKHAGKYNGIVCYQSISFVLQGMKLIEKMTELDPSWIGITSLFYEGDVHCEIDFQDYTRPTQGKPYLEGCYTIY